VLGCAMNQPSADGKVELRLVQCDGTCHLAPLIRHKGKYIGPLTTTQAIEFARGLRPQEIPPSQGPAE
jgi:NADH:ubiquinone oxidoreductase subunit E